MAPRKRPQQAEFSAEALDALIGDAKTAEDLDALFRRMKRRWPNASSGPSSRTISATAPGRRSRPRSRISATAARRRRSSPATTR